ncbi:MAG: hypothetical protein Rubg2KO_24910 [Rubricoccaceae bacterium]
MTAPPLYGLRIASPCDADWAAMPGTDRVRNCADCALNVYNLSEMTTREARALIRQHEGRLCVRLYRRADGTVLTRDCPEGVPDAATERRRGAVVALALATLFVGSIGMTQAAWSLLGSVTPHNGGTEVLMGDLVAPDDIEFIEMGEAMPMDLDPMPHPAPLMGRMSPPSTF